LGILSKYYPELKVDTWEAFARILDRAAQYIHAPGRSFTESDRLQVMLGALCLPLASDEVGVKNFLAKTTFSKKEVVGPIGALLKAVSEPRRIWKAAQEGSLTEKQVANEIRKVMKQIYPATPETLLALCEAEDPEESEVVSLERAAYPPAQLFQKYIAEHPEWLDPKRAVLLTGEDLKRLGVPPGPAMGKVMRQVEEARDRGEIETKEEALTWLAAQK
jgi:hypothetical protein